MKKTLVLILSLFTAQVAAQGIYKWVDANGQVHYGDGPPKKDAAELSVKTGPSASVTVTNDERAERQRRILHSMEAERIQKQEREKKAAQEAAERKRRCAYSRDRLRTFNEAGGLYDLDAKGDRRVLNDAERAAALTRAEDDVKKWCD